MPLPPFFAFTGEVKRTEWYSSVRAERNAQVLVRMRTLPIVFACVQALACLRFQNFWRSRDACNHGDFRLLARTARGRARLRPPILVHAPTYFILLSLFSLYLMLRKRAVALGRFHRECRHIGRLRRLAASSGTEVRVRDGNALNVKCGGQREMSMSDGAKVN
eukprot:5157068-Pleurochrysis_carterae.AAC.3